MADNTQEGQAKAKVTISIKGVQEDLSNGMTREQIGEKYGLNKAAVSRLFKHDKLKGLKTKLPKEEAFEIVDDAPARQAPKPKVAKEAGAAKVAADGTEVASSTTGAAPAKTGSW